MPASTRNAAVAVAASLESVGFDGGCTRYGRWPRSIALTASYTAPCTMAKCSTDTGGGCPAVTTIAFDAIRFQSVTASARTSWGDASATSARALKTNSIDVFLKGVSGFIFFFLLFGFRSLPFIATNEKNRSKCSFNLSFAGQRFRVQRFFGTDRL